MGPVSSAIAFVARYGPDGERDPAAKEILDALSASERLALSAFTEPGDDETRARRIAVTGGEAWSAARYRHAIERALVHITHALEARGLLRARPA